MERRLATILAIDVVGYSRLMRNNEEATLAGLIMVRQLIDRLAGEHGGRTFGAAGDSMLAEFSSPVEAVRCSIDVQHEIANTNANRAEGDQMQLRIGVNLGDIMDESGNLYGDGINVAARLESLSEPGGMCVSGTVYEQIRDRIDLTFRDIGEHEVKNISRPIHVYRWSPLRADEMAGETPETVSEKPSIAVLAFDNMSGDQEQEYFSDGLAEDIITELSRFSELFVIARNSSFSFKGKAIDVKETARQLGVQYVVEGSVRKAGSRIRVTAQLIDALAGAHIWAERYDRQLEDIFEVQDDVVKAIVAVLPGRIAEAGADRARRKPTSNMSDFDHLLRGNYAMFRRGDSLKEAIAHYKQAIEIDPQCAPAYTYIATAEGMSVWDLSTYDDSPLERAYEYGKRAIEIDPGYYRSHAAFGEALRQLGQHDLARQHFERARKLNPNSAQVLGYWGMLLAYTGEPKAAIDTYHQAIKLDPISQDNIRKEILAESLYMLERYEEAIAVLETMLKLPIFYVHQQLAMCHAQLGNREKCEHHMAQYRAELPDSYDERLLFESHLQLCRRKEDIEHWREGYRLTGMDV
ncbi:MAG: tetratricopeptide repeat protein [Rhodobacteraceae bacterium]|nr:tetratricopeptide repeat protein [Paracoccaceae bacterium]